MALLNSPSSKSPIWTRDRVSSPSRSHFSPGLKLILRTQVTNPEIATFQSLSKGFYASYIPFGFSLAPLQISLTICVYYCIIKLSLSYFRFYVENLVMNLRMLPPPDIVSAPPLIWVWIRLWFGIIIRIPGRRYFTLSNLQYIM